VEPPGPAETTQPIPAVEPSQPVPTQQPQPQQPPAASRPGLDQPTTALPLIDLLAPKQTDPLSTLPPPLSPAPPTPSPTTAMPPVPGLLSGPTPPGGIPPVGTPVRPGMGPVFGPAPAARRTGQLGWPVVAAIAGAALLLGLIGWLAIGSFPGNDRQEASPTPTTTPVRVAGGYQFIERATRTDADCAGNAYGRVSEFFRTTPCARLQRYLFTSSVDGRPVVVSVASVQMSTEQAATALKRLADTNGTGNVADLLRAGVRVQSVPEGLTDAAYASNRGGSTVVIVEADYTDPAQRSDDQLERISDAALQLGQS
jgi:hypothetical protein